MVDYKDKYLRAIKALDESEHESKLGVDSMYAALIAILATLKGRHRQIDKAINILPKYVESQQLPLDELERLKDILVSFLDDDERVFSAKEFLIALLDNAKEVESSQDESAVLLKMLDVAKKEDDFLSIARYLSTFLSDASNMEGGSVCAVSLKDCRELLFSQMEGLDNDFLQSIEISSLMDELTNADNLQALRGFSSHFFINLKKELLKKNNFIFELSGLIETVVHELDEFSSELKLESVERQSALEDRWRVTELMDGQVKTIRESVVQADSLVTLKSILKGRLDDLNKSVTNFVDLESERVQKAEDDARKIESKINRFESEISTLKASLLRAHEEALVDSLTGVANRRAYDERIRLEFGRWKRKPEPLVVAIMDVDHFKKVNDTYGHPVGDKVLRTISQLINKQVRESDFFGRVGGEEFVVVFSGSDLANAMLRLDQFRKSIETCKFASKGERVVITISIGCALFGQSDKPVDVYERADRALLQAKQTGRNKCVSEETLKN